MMRTVYGDHERFISTYFVQYPGKYFTGDGAYRDPDGYYWLTGRVDDVLNVSGHRLGSAEIEGALVGHSGCAEAAVVGYPHEIKGEGIYAYVLLKDGFNPGPELATELKRAVRTAISPIATPDKLQFVDGLPKTRSGKIMRRILRKVAEGNPDDVGDVTTLAEPQVVEAIIKGVQPTLTSNRRRSRAGLKQLDRLARPLGHRLSCFCVTQSEMVHRGHVRSTTGQRYVRRRRDLRRGFGRSRSERDR